MPSWSEILDRLNNDISKDKELKTQIYIQNSNYEAEYRVQLLNIYRKQDLENLYNYTNRNIIAYYSCFIDVNEMTNNMAISDRDLQGFMNAVHKLDKSRGLDLILHTPGGSITAAELIVNYLKSIFKNNIRVIVPQIAMSAGTMIACAAKEIVMGKQSSLGPIDPSVRGLSAYNVKEEFDRIIQECTADVRKIIVWKEILANYTPSLICECEKAIALSSELVSNWLSSNMFQRYKNREKIAKDIVDKHLNEKAKSKVHERHFNIDKCKSMGLKIVELEKDQTLQDLVLTLHHCYMIFLSSTAAVKILENHLLKSWIINGPKT